ncbi:MAG: hypothetical protein QOJ68_2360 [Blastococcus sp.]|nr:hypothetical protein [Blastococcus sp.]
MWRRCDEDVPGAGCPSSLAGQLPIATHMTSSLVEVADVAAAVEYRTTEVRCLVCVTTLPLDDDQQKNGTVRWKIVPRGRLTLGTAVSFDCPNGHSSDVDPHLLKAFPSRRF